MNKAIRLFTFLCIPILLVSCETSTPPTKNPSPMDVVCGTIRGLTCPVGQYCDFGPGQSKSADAHGQCKIKPALCTKEFSPVCGYDSKTYGNACTAASAGVSIDHQGECTQTEPIKPIICGGTAEIKCPEFPWPPPRASATEVIPSELLELKTGVTRLRDVEGRIRKALEENGYFDSSYYVVPGGFALVTRIEQINDDGTSREEPQRWLLEEKRPLKFSLSAFLDALFRAPPGYYRVIVFIVTPNPVVQSETKVKEEEASRWVGGGADRLPEQIGTLDFSQQYACTALVYEFRRRTESDKPTVLDPGNIQGRTHLMKAGIWGGLHNE